jgi:hypothetical protein
MRALDVPMRATQLENSSGSFHRSTDGLLKPAASSMPAHSDTR